MKVDRVDLPPEQKVCACARGDYSAMSVNEAEFAELMEPVGYDEHHVDAVHEVAVTVHDEDGNGIIELPDGQFYSSRLYGVPDPEIAYKMYALMDRELIRKGHWGPFEHAYTTFAVEGISVSAERQVTRHRHASFDVQSMRYVDFANKDEDSLVKIPKSFTDPDHFSRHEGMTEKTPEELEQAQETYEEFVEEMIETYEELSDRGFPVEDTRFVLGLGTNVNLTMSMNAHALMHILNIRGTGAAQWEVRELSEQLKDEFHDWMPLTAHCFEQHAPFKPAP